jgi:hypothetical protein
MSTQIQDDAVTDFPLPYTNSSLDGEVALVTGAMAFTLMR